MYAKSKADMSHAELAQQIDLIAPTKQNYNVIRLATEPLWPKDRSRRHSQPRPFPVNVLWLASRPV
jgi:hypothetical protein